MHDNQTDSDIKVSICSIAYNHGKYLRQCLDGFVMQETNFRYEILINDDASTDDTADIIREYEKKYPGIVRGIYHSENQYSKGIWPERFPFLAAKGKYIAMCEGDDYWSDPQKLQKQFDAMEANPDCHMCVHRVEIVTEDDKITERCYPPKSISTGVIRSKDFLKMICESYCFHTSSYFTVAKDMQYYMENPPDYTGIVEEAGDEKKFLYFGQLGNVFYIDDIMSRRREFSNNSWNSKNRNLTWQKSFERIRDLGKMMESYDRFTKYRFHDICQKRIDNSLKGQFGILQSQKQYKLLILPEYRSLRKKWSLKYRILVYTAAYVSITLEKIKKGRLL